MSGAFAARWRRWSRTPAGKRLSLVYALLLGASMLVELVAVGLALWFQLGAVLLPITVAMLLLVLPALGVGFVQRVVLPAPLVARWIMGLRGWPLFGALTSLGLWLTALALIWRFFFLGAVVLAIISLSMFGQIQRPSRATAAQWREIRAWWRGAR